MRREREIECRLTRRGLRGKLMRREREIECRLTRRGLGGD